MCHLLAHLLILWLRTAVLEAVNIYKNDKILTEVNLELQWPLWETFQLEKIDLRWVPEIKGYHIKQNGIPIFVSM